MKIVIFLLGVGGAVAASAGEWIINPELVATHSSSEPLFLSAESAAREVATHEGSEKKTYTRQPYQYLDILKVIPQSESKVTRAWLEYKILKSNND